MADQAPTQERAPRLLGGRYELGRLLGRGGMADVYVGRDTRLGRRVAIKLLRADLARDLSFQARFRREAQSAAGLNHPAIVAIYDTGEDTVIGAEGDIHQQPYIVMEHVEGRTLREVLEQGAPLPVGEALVVTEGVLSALAVSHRQGIVHRDIKPANVMLNRGDQVKVMDFGIARAIADSSATMTQTHTVLGTASYLSPEQARGEPVDARSDLYSTGCLLFELLTGRPPFVADSPVAVAYQHVQQPPLPPSALANVPPDVDRVVLKALAKDRDTRYATAEQFMEDVRRAAEGRPLAFAGDGATHAGERMAAAGGPGVGAGAARVSEGYTGAFDDLGWGQAHGASAGGGPAAANGVGPVLAPTGDAAGGYGASAVVGSADADLARWNETQSRRRRRTAYTTLVLSVVVVFAAVGWLLYDHAQQDRARVSVPAVVGLTFDAARQAVEAKGLHLVQDPAEANEAVPKDHVIRQAPDEGSSVLPRSSVTVVLSTGPGTVSVPPLARLTQQDARQKLRDAGLQPGDVRPQNSGTLAKDLVIGSAPPAGQVVPIGQTVVLVVSTGLAQVPDVVGKQDQQAREILANAGLHIIEPRYRPTASRLPGTVLAQSPSNAAVDPKTPIVLTIATPQPPPTTVTTTATPSPTETPSTPPSTETSSGPAPSPTSSGG